MSVKAIPEGYHSVVPYIVVNDGAAAIDFYRRAFGAQVKERMDAPGGKIAHAELKIGDSIVMLADEMPRMSTKSPRSLGGTTGGLFLYVDDVDKRFKQAADAGANIEMQPQDMFWGDRYGKLMDPFGHSWSMATHKEDVKPEEMQRRMRAEMAKMGQAQSGS